MKYRSIFLIALGLIVISVFLFFKQIAPQYAEVSPSSPVIRQSEAPQSPNDLVTEFDTESNSDMFSQEVRRLQSENPGLSQEEIRRRLDHGFRRVEEDRAATKYHIIYMAYDALQEYHKYYKEYPKGDDSAISAALVGINRDSKRFLSIRSKQYSQKDGILDPWNTPIKFDLKGSGASIHCAGPDRRFGTVDDMSTGLENPK